MELPESVATEEMSSRGPVVTEPEETPTPTPEPQPEPVFASTPAPAPPVEVEPEVASEPEPEVPFEDQLANKFSAFTLAITQSGNSKSQIDAARSDVIRVEASLTQAKEAERMAVKSSQGLISVAMSAADHLIAFVENWKKQNS